MEILRLVLRYAHLIGFAVLLGGAVVQYFFRPLRINPAMLWGSVIQLVTGVALSAPLRGDAIMVWVPRKRQEVNSGHFAAIVGLTLVNAAVATFW